MQLQDVRLRNLPKHWKVFALGYLMALSLSYFYALVNIALVIGFTPKDIMIHYYGADKKIEIVSQANQSEEEFSLDDIEEKDVAIIAQPSLKTLVAEGHFHLFGMTSFFFGLCLLGLFTSVKAKTKVILMIMPFVTIVVDNLSFLATRFLGPNFAYLTAVAGGLMFISFSCLWVVIFRDIVLPAEAMAE